jgi:serine/threonine protein kinase/Tol biopolymer transport system component
MAITVGTSLGRYEIRSHIGSGGMGEVYLAQDTQLRRPVAIKLLPESFTRDEDRVHRFEQEAYAASALNHPNILTIYEIGEINSTHFIAMEYVEGVTLRQHITRSHVSDGQAAGAGIKLGEVLDIAIQIASALSASQAAGIAHRDIKPENIMVRRDGYVKVLDFGLAKLAERPQADTEAPTRALVNTSPGAVMGTVNYMSPEQAKGQPVDARSDIWSLGVVIYEMITGRLPFEGPTSSHVVVAILEKEPPLLARYLSGVLEALEWIVTKALTKDQEDRYQTAREMLMDLRRLKQRLDAGSELERSVAPETGSGHVNTGSQTDARTFSGHQLEAKTMTAGAPQTISSAEYLVGEVKRHKLGFLFAIIAVLLVAVGTWWAWSRFRDRSPETRPFQNMRLTRLTETGKATLAAISPDAKYVVHVVNDGGQSSLWVRQAATSSNVQIVAPTNGRFIGLNFSPDGTYVYYTIYEKQSPVGIVYQIPALGGQPRRILEDSDTGVTFSPDGKRFAFVRLFPQSAGSSLVVANADGSDEVKLITREFPHAFNGGIGTGPSWSPDGNSIACSTSDLVNGVLTSGLSIVDVNRKVEMLMNPAKWVFIGQVRWTPSGKGLIVTASEEFNNPVQLWYVPYPAGRPERITNDLNTYNGVAVSADGSALATVESQIRSNLWLAPSGNAAQATQITYGKNEGVSRLSWTNDGRVVFSAVSGGNSDLWTVKPDGTEVRPLTTSGGFYAAPASSPDGKYIVFFSTRSGSPQIYRMNTDGRETKQLTFEAGAVSPAVSPDSLWVIYNNVLDNRLWKISIEGGTPVKISDKLAGQAAVSPDGKLIACRYREEVLKPFQLGLISLETGKTVKAIDFPATTAGGGGFQWTSDGKSVMYVDTRNGVSNIWSQPIDGSPPKHVTDFKSDQIFTFSWSKDGKQLMLARGRTINDVIMILNEVTTK